MAGVCFDEYFAFELIRKGADIHLTDDSGFTFLHLAAKSDTDDNLAVGRLIIEKGANINQQAHYGVTALYAACEIGNFDWICMLLYFGADASIGTDRGILPISVISQDISEEKQLQLQEILFNYTFDKYKGLIRLPSLVAAMTLNSSLFSKMLDNISNIVYDLSDLQHMVSSLIHIKPKHLKLFMEKFGYIVKEMIENFPPLDVLIKLASDCGFLGLKGILDVFLNSDYVAEFIQCSEPSLPTISRLLEVFNNPDQFVEEEDFSKIIYIMLSYGLGVNSVDLDSVYNCYGYCELFQILLYMDVLSTNNKNDGRSIAVMFYNPQFTLESLEKSLMSSTLLHYYNHPKLKEYLLANSDESETLEKVKDMPQVPYLVELSRNAVRQYIVKKFNIEKSAKFYTILQWLPVGEMNRKIIALEKKLY